MDWEIIHVFNGFPKSLLLGQDGLLNNITGCNPTFAKIPNFIKFGAGLNSLKSLIFRTGIETSSLMHIPEK